MATAIAVQAAAVRESRSIMWIPAERSTMSVLENMEIAANAIKY
ncbi:hypothetical protein ACQCT6_03890 [Cytobacillus gottheilii]